MTVVDNPGQVCIGGLHINTPEKIKIAARRSAPGGKGKKGKV